MFPSSFGHGFLDFDTLDDHSDIAGLVANEKDKVQETSLDGLESLVGGSSFFTRNAGLGNETSINTALSAAGSSHANTESSSVINTSLLLTQQLNPSYQSIIMQITALSNRVMHLERQLAILANMAVPAATQSSKQLSREQLDSYCNEKLKETTDPTNVELNQLAGVIERDYPEIPRKSIISQIRKWFRKRREDFTTKINNALKDYYKKELGANGGPARLLHLLDRDEVNVGEVIKRASLNVPDTPKLRHFCKEKMKSFIERQ